MSFADPARLHPSRWPLLAWTLLALIVALLRVEYTLGSFSFAPAVALLSGTWLGARRAAVVQTAAGAALVPIAWLAPQLIHPGEWGFRLGLIGAAALAGRIATPDDRGAHPPRAVRLAVFGTAGATAALGWAVVPRVTSGNLGFVFGLTFVLATAIGVFYAYKMVSEPARVLGYFFCLLPFYAAGVVGNLLLAALRPDLAAAAGIPAGWREVLFHAYLSHLPGELISLVVIAYVVCVIDRAGTVDGALTIGASR